MSNAGITPTINNQTSRRAVNGVFGSVGVTFNDWWTVEGSLRQDASSTLPKGENSYFYPWHQHVDGADRPVPGLCSADRCPTSRFAAAIARVGADASPYQLATTYNGSSTKFGSLPLFTLGNTIANANLLPELTTSHEAGFELGLCDGRATIEGTWYNKDTKNQILNLTVSNASGFSGVSINAGDLNNRGFEAHHDGDSAPPRPAGLDVVIQLRSQLRGGPLARRGLDEHQPRQPVGAERRSARSGSGDGQAAALRHAVRLTVCARQRRQHSHAAGGPPTKGAKRVLGNIQARVDGRLEQHASLQVALAQRPPRLPRGRRHLQHQQHVRRVLRRVRRVDEGPRSRLEQPGPRREGHRHEDARQPNTINVTAEQYYQDACSNCTRRSSTRTRTPSFASFAWATICRSSLASRMYASAVNVAFIGRNLYTWTNVPNVDPEFAYSTGNSQGMEFAALPNARSFGFNVKLTP